MSAHVVKIGETLELIAARLLGSHRRWPEIYEANKAELDARFSIARPALLRTGTAEITEPWDYIVPGQRLNIPPPSTPIEQ